MKNWQVGVIAIAAALGGAVVGQAAPPVLSKSPAQDTLFQFSGGNSGNFEVTSFTDVLYECTYIVVRSPEGVAVTPRLMGGMVMNANMDGRPRVPRCQA